MKNIVITTKMLIIFLLFASCSDDFLDVNTDPNNPETVSPDLVLPVAQSYSANIQEGREGQNLLGNLLMYNWSQSDGFSWYPDEFSYNVTASFYDQIFDYTYVNTLKQYNVLNTLEEEENGYYKAIGKIMIAYHFQILVDTYGDIPYSEALQRGLNPTPKYDDAQTIYNDLIVQLSSAIDLINTTASNSDLVPTLPGADDTMFGGDMAMWKKFANTVKLRILVRQSDVSGQIDYIKSEFAAINSEGSGFMNSDVEVQLGYLDEDNKQNPKWARFGQKPAGAGNTLSNDATCATPYALNRLNLDPRLDFIYEKPDTGHLGVIQGELNYDIPVVDQFAPDLVSNIGPGILKGFDQGAVLYTAAESYFNRAEAITKGLMSGDAKLMYESGIQASFNYLGAGDATPYFSRNANLIGWDASADKIEAIINQKWLALNGIDALQSWFDYSRTGFPSDLPVSATATTADRPVRLFYASSEITSNGNNLPTQQNAFTAKIFWAN